MVWKTSKTVKSVHYPNAKKILHTRKLQKDSNSLTYSSICVLNKKINIFGPRTSQL